MNCGGAWQEVANTIGYLYMGVVGLQSQAALAGDVVDELLLLREDLEAWGCFDGVEFWSRLRRLERQLAAVEARLRAGIHIDG